MQHIRVFLTIGIYLIIHSLFVSSLSAQDSKRNIIVEDIPSLEDINRVSASHTHSGYPVPRYVSLKFNRVNGRSGPSTQHAKAWEYQRKGLPLVVVAEMDIWRKVRDMHGDESWVRTYALSGKRYVITVSGSDLRTKPKESARIKATAPKDTVLQLEECRENWCEVKSDTGHKGWVKKGLLWGAEPL